MGSRNCRQHSAMAENFNGLMRERETSVSQMQQELARLRADTSRAESERDGPILANVKSSILQPTAFSAVK